jgi:hypothetical protein
MTDETFGATRGSSIQDATVTKPTKKNPSGTIESQPLAADPVATDRAKATDEHISAACDGRPQATDRDATDGAALAAKTTSGVNKGRQQGTDGESSGSAAKIQGFIGIVAITVGNIAAILTHVDEIRQFISKLLGTEWAYRFHNLVMIGAFALFLIGYASLSYWLYWNFFAHKTRLIRGGFCVAALLAVSTIMLGSYFLFRQADLDPLLLKQQTDNYTQTILSQQFTGGDDDGGFRFSQGGISNDVQVWTTAQCLTALLRQDAASLKNAGPAIRRAFDYVERLRLKSPGDGWGYLKDFNWGVTEIDGWVALAYIYSLNADNAAKVWKADEIPTAIASTNSILALLLRRQHTDGGWGPIAQTSNTKHERTYSTIMALWALAEAEQNGDIVKGHDEEYRAAVTSGAKWLLEASATNSEGFSGWWPNPSAHYQVGAYPGLTAHTLFVLSVAKSAHSFIGADSKYKDSVQSFIKLAFDGNDKFEPLTSRKIFNNEKAHDSDRYLEGRTETMEQSTFLWYPWTIALGASLQRDPILLDYQQDRLRNLVSKLLERIDEEDAFARHDEVIYPTAEMLFAEGFYFSRNGSAMKPN